MATADDVNNALGGPGSPGNPPDTIVVYDGATVAANGFASWKAWDLRGTILTLVHDLLRFRPLSDGKPNPGVKRGLFDWVLQAAYQTDQNNTILRRIAAKTPGVDISDLL
jgi:hypothetical protein